MRYHEDSDMTNTEKLQQRLNELPESEREILAARLLRGLEEELRADAWDRQLEADYKAGKLDEIIRQAEEDIAAGRTYPLP